MDDIAEFLKRFHEYNTVDDTFTSGCCYWFAVVLCVRFAEEKPVIMYDEVANHFGTKIKDRVYDITGDVTKQYTWYKWSEMSDILHKERIIKDCIMF